MTYWSESSGSHHDSQGLEHRAQVERLRVLDLVGLKERNPRGALTAVCNCVVGLYKGGRAQIFLEVHMKDKRQQKQVAVRKF